MRAGSEERPTPGLAGDFMDEEARYRLLVDAVTDYAIYMLDPDGHRGAAGTPAPSASRATPPTRSSASISPASIPSEDRAGRPAARARWRPRRARASSRPRAGACARTARASGPTSSSTRSATPRGELIGFAKITRDLTERRQAAGGAAAAARSSSACWCRASPTTPSTCSTRGPGQRAGTPAPSASRATRPDEIIGQHFSRFYTEEDRAAGVPARALADRRARRAASRSEGWRVRKDGTRFWAHVVIDPIRDDDGRADRLRQDHPRHHRAARGAARAGAGARGAVPVAEDGRDRPAHRRRRARLQQPADGGARQPRAGAQARCRDDPRVAPLLDNAMQARRSAAPP